MATQAIKGTLAAVIPCYRVGGAVLKVLEAMGPEVAHILVVDDACPQNTGQLVKDQSSDPRVEVIANPANLGVGGAVAAGYARALELGAMVVVKLDGDGQMDPADIPALVEPVLNGQADYAKGNRFHSPDYLAGMPWLRLFGNAVLSFISKLASGYWNLMDPTNGFTAIHASALKRLPLGRMHKGYFFESDMLTRLSLIRAVVEDVPLPARYGSEVSSLNILRAALTFPGLFFKRMLKRIAINYFLRDFNVGSVQLLAGSALLIGGGLFGLIKWAHSMASGVPASSGTVMLAALPVFIGVQMLLGFISFDVANIPKRPLQGLPEPANHSTDG